MDSMVTVTKDDFYAALNADRRDIMPDCHWPEFHNWKTKDGVLFGRSYPGWKNPGDEKRYLLVRSTLTSQEDEARET